MATTKASPIEHALLNGDKKTGITIFKLVEKMDAGPILAKDEVFLDQNINKGELIQKLNHQGTKLLNSILPKIFSKENTLLPQDENKVTYAYKISSKMRKLDFSRNFEIFLNFGDFGGLGDGSSTFRWISKHFD